MAQHSLANTNTSRGLRVRENTADEKWRSERPNELTEDLGEEEDDEME